LVNWWVGLGFDEHMSDTVPGLVSLPL